MIDFEIKEPVIRNPEEIEKLSLENIQKEAADFSRFNTFTADQKAVAARMIHTTTCFEQVINGIHFSNNATDKIKELLRNGASIVSDTNMIKTGLSKVYTEKYNNKTICYIAEPDIKEKALAENTTRAVASVRKALEELKNTPTILACGNAPTFLYAAIENLIKTDWDLSKVAILAMPVGFINVIESKEYTFDFMNKANVEGLIMNGRFGGSTLVVSSLHALYKLI